MDGMTTGPKGDMEKGLQEALKLKRQRNDAESKAA
jgi:hypothetical protein